MATLDRYVREEIAHTYCFRVTDPQLRQHFVNIVNDLYGVTHTGPRGRTIGHTSDNRARISEPRFPGAVPCSIMREDLDLLRKEHYVAFEKTNGTRYLMLCTSLPGVNRDAPPTNFCVLINRRWEARIVRVQFAQDVYDRNTLFDGELVQNVDSGRWVFLIFDLVSSGRVSTSRDNYIKRMKEAHNLVYNSLQQDPSGDAFDISVKRYEKMEQMDRLYNADKQYRGFPTDGYVFMPVRRHVAPFRNREILKWKDTSNSTIDLQLRYSAENGLEYWMKDTRNAPKFFGPVAIDFTLAETHTELIQKYAERVRSAGDRPIVECAFDQKRHLWFMVCERSDKQSPNAEYTVERTLENVRENITKDELFHIIANERVGYRPNHQQQPPGSQRPVGFGANVDDPFGNVASRQQQPIDDRNNHRYHQNQHHHQPMRNQVPQQQYYRDDNCDRGVRQPPTHAPQSFVHKDRQAFLGASAIVPHLSRPNPPVAARKQTFVAEHDARIPYYENTSFETPKPIADPPETNLHSSSSRRRQSHRESSPFFKQSPYAHATKVESDDSTSSEIFGQPRYRSSASKMEENVEGSSVFTCRQKRKIDSVSHASSETKDYSSLYNSRPPRTNGTAATSFDTPLSERHCLQTQQKPVPFHPSLVEDDAMLDDAPPPSHFLPPENVSSSSSSSVSGLTFSASPHNSGQRQQHSQQPPAIGFVPILVDDTVDDSQDQTLQQFDGSLNIQDMLAQLSEAVQSAPDSALANALKKAK